MEILNQLKIIEKETEIFLKTYQDMQKPFLLIDNTKKENSLVQEKSTPTENKGVETMKKNCTKRKDGRWQYSKQKDGYLYYAIANTYRQLIEKIKNIKPKPIKGIKHKTTKTNQNTFLQYYQYFIDNFIKNKNIGEETKKDWQRQLDKDITPVFKYIKLQDLKLEYIQNFIDKIDKERKQEVVYQRICKVLKKAYATNKIKTDFSIGLEKPIKQNTKTRMPLTMLEQIKLLKASKNTKVYAFIVFSLIIGSRREETIKFNYATDVNEKKCEIHIKGTKTINSDRYVKTTKTFLNFLKQQLPEGKFDFNLYYPTKELKKILTKIKINNCLHGLRHTCSANLYFLGARDKYRQSQLGHASITTTNDIYTNIKENIPTRYLRLVYGDLYPTFD